MLQLLDHKICRSQCILVTLLNNNNFHLPLTSAASYKFHFYLKFLRLLFSRFRDLMNIQRRSGSWMQWILCKPPGSFLSLLLPTWNYLKIRRNDLDYLCELLVSSFKQQEVTVFNHLSIKEIRFIVKVWIIHLSIF